MSSSTPDAPGPARSVRPWAWLAVVLRIRPENRFTVGVVLKADSTTAQQAEVDVTQLAAGDRPAAIVVCPR